MDELAAALGIDPVELRLRNEPDTEPDTGRPFSSRHLVDCLREGARRFGWAATATRGRRRAGRATCCSARASPQPPIRSSSRRPRPRRRHRPTAATWCASTPRTSAPARAPCSPRSPPTRSACPGRGPHRDRQQRPAHRARVAGGSSGTASWGWAVTRPVRPCRPSARPAGPLPADGLTADADHREAQQESPYARHAFGAHFAEVAGGHRHRGGTGPPAARRLRGRPHPQPAHRALPVHRRNDHGPGHGADRGQHLDPAFGDFTERDLASYHVPACADVPDIEAHWIEEDDPHLNPMGSKGIGEIGIVGTAAAIGNAVHHATGVRQRALPLTPDRVLAPPRQ